jgi:hypothetical protein
MGVVARMESGKKHRIGFSDATPDFIRATKPVISDKPRENSAAR